MKKLFVILVAILALVMSLDLSRSQQDKEKFLFPCWRADMHR